MASELLSGKGSVGLVQELFDGLSHKLRRRSDGAWILVKLSM